MELGGEEPKMEKIFKILVSLLLILLIGFAVLRTKPSNSKVERGAITIAFDDGNLNQYQYAWPEMKKRGVVGTFYIVSDGVDIKNKMSWNQLLELQNQGCEIASHSKTHPNFLELSESEICYECQKSKEDLESHGLEINNFAYPGAKSNAEIDSIVKDYYSSGRYGWKVMQFPHTEFRVYGYAALGTGYEDYERLVNKVEEVYEKDGWTIITFHHVYPEDIGIYGISQSDFAKFLDYTLSKGVRIITVREALGTGFSDDNYTVTIFRNQNLLLHRNTIMSSELGDIINSLVIEMNPDLIIIQKENRNEVD